MSVFKNPLIRYRILDECFQNRQRRWTKQSLLETLNHKLREQHGAPEIGPRTLATDISNMRDGVGGEGPAPIKCDSEGFYTYEDPAFKYFLTPFSTTDAAVLRQALAMLRQFQGLGLSAELNELVRRAEGQMQSHAAETERPRLHFSAPPDYAGTAHLQPLYQAIGARQVLRVRYQKFGAAEPATRAVQPVLLKEYNQRWFLLARDPEYAALSTFALDRIIDFEPLHGEYQTGELDADAYFAEVIGATVPATAAEDIRLLFRAGRGDYVLTKKLHPSQHTIRQAGAEVEIGLRLRLNRELETVLLSFGEDVEVLAPESLRERLRQRFAAGSVLYNTEDKV